MLWLAARSGLGVAVLVVVLSAASGQGTQPAPPFDVRVQGSIPVQYTEILRGTSSQNGVIGAPYLSLLAARELQPGLTSAAFVEGGHAPLGQFRDNDNTFTSFGGNIVKRWGQFSLGTSLERTHFYDGVFGPTNSIANDVNIFARHGWSPNADLRITPSAVVNLRFDDTFSAQRYTVNGRVDIERRLIGAWWLVAIPRVRYDDYTGDQAGRRDFSASIVAGLKYEFNANVSARMLAGYDNRTSTVADRNRERFIVGVSLDFEFAFGRPW